MYESTLGVSRLRTDGRWSDHEEFPVSGIDVVRSNNFEMQLVVLRRLQSFQEFVRQQYTY